MWPQKDTSSRNTRRLKKAAFEQVSFPLQAKLLLSLEKPEDLQTELISPCISYLSTKRHLNSVGYQQ